MADAMNDNDNGDTMIDEKEEEDDDVQPVLMPLPDYYVCARDTYPFREDKAATGLISKMLTVEHNYYFESGSYAAYAPAFVGMINLMRGEIDHFFDDVYCPLVDPQKLKLDMPVLTTLQQQDFHLEEMLEFRPMATPPISGFHNPVPLYQTIIRRTAHPMLVKVMYEKLGESGRLERMWPRYYIEARSAICK